MTRAADTPTSGYAERWKSHNVERRAAILAAAADLVEQSPPGADVPVQRVADQAGVAKSVVYRQFKGKDDLERTLRQFVLDQFADELETDLDISHGSLRSILARTIDSAATWMSEHPRLVELLRAGPAAASPDAPDAIGELKRRIVQRSDDTIAALAVATGADRSAFEAIPFVVVNMVEATLTSWIRGESAATVRSRDEMVAALTDITWFILDGAAHTIGVTVDPDEELATVVAGLTVPQDTIQTV
ncbi:TetR/AcrR family transcriptional regulator [Tsukamurella soli]|uniref:TetR/AcrR family transcriptional regulator n=1 Tax=Tsukamurella soli TaxID=644556 RepID=A0ABP8JXB6_9ACTN